MTDLAAAPADLTIRYARVLPATELRDGELIPVEINRRPVVLVRHAGTFYAVQNNCSHKDFPLSESRIESDSGAIHTCASGSNGGPMSRTNDSNSPCRTSTMVSM